MVTSDRRLSGYVHGVVYCLPRCGLKYRDACQLSHKPLGDAEQVLDGAQLEHGEELRACACGVGFSPPAFLFCKKISKFDVPSKILTLGNTQI